MRFRIALLLALIVSLALPLAARAQSGVLLDTVQVALWPEYDQPNVLVINYITISPTVNLPADVSFRIPASAGAPSAVAMRDVAGLVNLSYTTVKDGEWLRINFKTTVQDLQIEYYDPGLKKDGTNRTFEYRWAGDYPVTHFSVQVQQPVGASMMQLPPQFGQGTPGNDGLTYYTADVGSLKTGTAFTVDLSYTKKDDTLSAKSQPVQSQPVNPATPGRLTFSEVLPWLGLGLGVLLVAVGFLWYWQSGRANREGETRKRRRGRVPARETETSTSTQQAIYCHQCGRRANGGDVFCRTCGTRLRA